MWELPGVIQTLPANLSVQQEQQHLSWKQCIQSRAHLHFLQSSSQPSPWLQYYSSKHNPTQPLKSPPHPNSAAQHATLLNISITWLNKPPHNLMLPLNIQAKHYTLTCHFDWTSHHNSQSTTITTYTLAHYRPNTTRWSNPSLQHATWQNIPTQCPVHHHNPIQLQTTTKPYTLSQTTTTQHYS